MTLPAGTYSFEIQYSYVGKPVILDTALGYIDIYGTANLEWRKYITNFFASENVLKIENITFNTDIPKFELRMMTNMAVVKIERVIIYKQ